jgi:pimeloyl-ACP methyl ester carboxylesterase
MRVNYFLSTFLVLISLAYSSCSTGICSQNVIDEDVYITTEDTKLFANVRSNDSLAPVLLYLHGGPGSPLGVPLLKAYAGPQLEDYFIMVYLHQRGIMKSERVDDDAHNISKYVEDIHYVVNYLKNRFKGREIYLLGHSWGGLLSYMYLLKYENEVDKFVAVCVPLDAEAMTYGRIDMMLQWASGINNRQAIDELNALKNKPVSMLPDDAATLQKWMSRAYGGWHRNLDMNKVNRVIDYEEDIPAWLNEQKHVESLLINEILNITLTDSIRKLDIPLLCMAGKEDTDVPWYIVKEEFDKYGGPKTFRLFENSHHMIFIDEEDLFVETIVKFLRTK